MKHKYSIQGMHCNGCVKSVENALSQVEGVQEVKVDLEAGKAQIDMNKPIPVKALQEALSSAGPYLILAG